MLLNNIRHRLKTFRSYGLDRLDRKLARYLPRKPGIFIELGANDGITQSNTYYLEKYKGWTGILIEPLPDLYEKCVQNRPASKVFRCACTDPETARLHEVEMLHCNLMSMVHGALGDDKRERAWIEDGERMQNLQASALQVPCQTLDAIIEQCGNPKVDLLSLDVEGYERQVLKGLDLREHRPRLILVETLLTPQVQLETLLDGYEVVAALSPRDVLFHDNTVAVYT